MKHLPKGKFFEKLSELAQQEKIETYIIGGYVRDLLLNRPSKDVDIVVVGNGCEFAEKLASLLNKKIKVTIFKNFGTAMFRYKDYVYEFVGARRESYQRNSRKPIVENGNITDDQNRRDFTINALAISMNSNNYGQIIDPFGGIDDLYAKIIKTPLSPDITFSDDPLRMMRAIRFAGQLNFKIHQKSLQAISENANRIKIISKERITDELNKIILAPVPSVGLKLLFNTGLLKIIFPELYSLQGVDIQGNISHKDVFFHSLKVLDNISKKTDNLWLRWTALLHDIGKPKTKKFVNKTWTFYGHQTVGAKMIPGIFKHLRLPLNDKMKYVQKLIEMHHRPISLAGEPITDSAVRRLIFDASNNIDDLLLLAESDITTQKKYKQERFLKNYEELRKKINKVKQTDFIRNWKPPIDGNQIMEILKLQPSKKVGILKNEIKNAILDGKIENTYEAAYNYLINYEL